MSYTIQSEQDMRDAIAGVCKFIESCPKIEQLMVIDRQRYRSDGYEDGERVCVGLVRGLCYDMLFAANADGLCGCMLCQN